MGLCSLLGQHSPEGLCLLRETVGSFTCLTLIYQFQWVLPPSSSAEFGEKQFCIHLIHDFANFDHIFLSSKAIPNALLSVPFLRTPSTLFDSVAATAHWFQRPISVGSFLTSKCQFWIWHCVGRIYIILCPYASSTFLRIPETSLLPHSHQRWGCDWA